MNKSFFFVAVAFFVSLCMSCNREPVEPDNPTNPGQFDTYAQIEEYCMENGWTEKYMTSGDCFEDEENCMSLCYINGTCTQYSNYSSVQWIYNYKMFSSFSSLLSANNSPTAGYIESFTCDDMRFGICRFIHREFYGENGVVTDTVDHIGYAKFYVRKTEPNKIKLFYKKCNLPVE